MRNDSENVVEKIKRILFSNLFFFENRAFYETMWKNTEESDRPQMAHAHCMLDT